MRIFGSNYQALAHRWAYGDEGYCYGHRMYTGSDGVLYSYGSHYKLAKRTVDKNGNTVFLVNSTGSSVTTARQKRCVMNAVYGTVFEIPSIDLNHSENISYYCEEITNLLNKAKKARTRHDEYIIDAVRFQDELRLYIDSFKVDKRKLTKANRLLLTANILSEFNTTLDSLNKAKEKADREAELLLRRKHKK